MDLRAVLVDRVSLLRRHNQPSVVPVNCRFENGELLPPANTMDIDGVHVTCIDAENPGILYQLVNLIERCRSPLGYVYLLQQGLKDLLYISVCRLNPRMKTELVVGHPSGKLVVGAQYNGEGKLRKHTVYQTARTLIEEKVFWGVTVMARQELVYEICSRRGLLLYTCSW